MKKKILAIAFIISTMFSCTGCTNIINMDEAIKSPNSKFIDLEVVDNNYYNAILVDRNTNVMYYWNMSNAGGIIPIYNSDGTLKLYEE